MAAAVVDIPVLDGTGASIPHAKFWSSDGTATGSLAPVTVVVDSTFVPLDYTATSPVGGLTASGSSLTANPVTVGGRAATALPTAVADGQVVNALMSKYGAQISPAVLRDVKGVQETVISGTGETTIVTADASNKLDLYGLIIANTNASNVVSVAIKDATAGTTRTTIQIPANDTRGFLVSADSGIAQATANNNWTATGAGTSPTFTVTALYIKAGA